jgi:HK97 family phage major capsid protein
MPDEKKTPEIPDTLTMEQLQGIIKTAVQGATKDEVAALKTEILSVDRGTMFSGAGNKDFAEGSVVQTADGSVVDTSFFHKSYANDKPGQVLGSAMGLQMMQMGGPFKKLSPAMETFAKMILCRGKFSKCQASGIDIAGHNAKMFAQMQQLNILSKQAGMNEGVVADGGALVPVEYPATVIEFAFTQSPILSRVWRMPMTSNVMKIPRLVQAAGNYFGGIQFYSPGEGEEKTSSKPTFERITFEAKKRIGLVYLTDELVADSLINIVNYVTGLYTRGFMYDMESLVLNNTAAAWAAGTPCMGIITDPAVVANGIARNVAGTINYTDLCNLDAQLDENFRDLVWMTRKRTLATLRNERDSQNRPIVAVDYSNFQSQRSAVPQMFGYPVYLTRNCPAMGSTGDIVLGDLGFYMLAMRQDLTIDMSEHVRFVYDEMCLRFVARYDGQAIVPIAFTELVSAQS